MIATAPNTEHSTLNIDTDIKPDEAEPAEKFVIDSESSANWLLRRLADITAERDLIKAQSAARVKELTADYDRLMFLFGDQLKAWAREEANRRRRQGVTLMYGTCAFRSTSARLVIADAEAALAWATEQGDFRHLTPTLDKDAYMQEAQRRLEGTGELLPGVENLPEGESFSLSFKSKGTGE